MTAGKLFNRLAI